MLIGLKLDIGFAQDRVYRQLYGARDILPFLKELGFGAVETPVGPETEPDPLREHIARCVGAGLKISLHPYSEATIFNPLYFSPDVDNPCRELHERFLSLASEAATMQQFPTVVNIHGAAGACELGDAEARGEGREEPSNGCGCDARIGCEERTAAVTPSEATAGRNEPRNRLTIDDRAPSPSSARAHLLSRSIAFFTWAGRWCRDNAPQVGVTVELQISPDPAEPRQRIGDTYDELLTVATQSGVGACWDLGHAYWNTRRYGWPITPPEALLKRIVHVHCHDASTEDHQPLMHNNVPWREFINLLRDHGFDGRVILEVPPDQFLRAGGLQTLLDSAEALGACR